MRILFFSCLFLLATEVSAQHYSFRYLNSNDDFIVNNAGNEVYCLFKARKLPDSRVFRKVFLSENLKAVDSTEYEVMGNADLISTIDNEGYSCMVFRTKFKKVHSLEFIITDHSGNILRRFSKTSLDLVPVFGREVRVTNLNVNVIQDSSPDLLLVEFAENSASDIKLVAFNSADGSFRWRSDILSLGFIRTTGSEVIGLTKTNPGGKTSYAMHFIAKSDGKRRSAMISNPDVIRAIDVFATNGSEILVAGAQSESSNTKNSKLYLSVYDMNGKMIFEKIDTTDRMGKYRRHLMGSTFDRSGNLVLIGEGYRLDVTRAVATTAAAVAIGVLSGGNTIIVGNTSTDNKVEFISSAVLSTATGDLQFYRNFPVGPWYSFPSFYTDGERILIGIRNKFLLYNVNEPETAPSQYATLKNQESLILTAFGPAVIYRDAGRKRVFVEMVEKENPTKIN